MLYPCPCCNYLTYDKEPGGSFDICPVCNWEDDCLQLHDPDFRGGANVVCLNEARENFKNFGASEERFIKNVRAPQKDELPEDK